MSEPICFFLCRNRGKDLPLGSLEIPPQKCCYIEGKKCKIDGENCDWEGWQAEKMFDVSTD